MWPKMKQVYGPYMLYIYFRVMGHIFHHPIRIAVASVLWCIIQSESPLHQCFGWAPYIDLRHVFAKYMLQHKNADILFYYSDKNCGVLYMPHKFSMPHNKGLKWKYTPHMDTLIVYIEVPDRTQTNEVPCK